MKRKDFFKTLFAGLACLFVGKDKEIKATEFNYTWVEEAIPQIDKSINCGARLTSLDWINDTGAFRINAFYDELDKRTVIYLKHLNTDKILVIKSYDRILTIDEVFEIAETLQLYPFVRISRMEMWC